MGPKMATITPQIAVGLTWRRLAMNMHTKAASNQINAGKYVLMLNSSDSVLQLKIQLNPIWRQCAETGQMPTYGTVSCPANCRHTQLANNKLKKSK